MQKNISPIQLIQLMTHNSLSLYKKKGSRFPLSLVGKMDKQTNQSKKNGVVFVSRTKEEVSNGIGHIITSYETIAEQYNHLSHWTPNTFRGGTYINHKQRIIKGHTKDNLKQVNVLGFDIDKKIDLYQVFLGCDEAELPHPNVILETPRGYQIFFILDVPFYLTSKSNYKALNVAEKISSNIKAALVERTQVDINCVSFGFFRIPNDENIVYFNDQLSNTQALISWSIRYSKANRKQHLKVVYSKDAAQNFNSTKSEWYYALITNNDIHKGLHGVGRNNALFTLAVANYASGISYEEAYDTLDEFNSNLSAPLIKSEFERTIKSAYSGKYQGPSRDHVENLISTWLSEDIQFNGPSGWYKFKKERKDRVRSHYDEWEEDIVTFIHNLQDAKKPFYESSLRAFARELNIPLSSLKKVLQRSKLIVKKSIGKGKNACTYFSTRTLLIQNLLQKRQEFLETKQLNLFTFSKNMEEIVKGSSRLNNGKSILNLSQVFDNKVNAPAYNLVI